MNPVDDFLKHAGFMDLLRGLGRGISGSMEQLPADKILSGGEKAGRVIGQVGVPALAAAGLAAVGQGVSKGLGAITNRFTKARDYKAMLQANPALAQADASTTQMYFNSLRHVSPSLSKDPLVAGSFVRNMMELQPESGPAIPIQTTKLLADAQKSISQARAGHPIAEAFAGGKPSFYEMTRQRPEPGPELAFTMGPGGMQGRFPSEAAAEEFARRQGLPTMGPERPQLIEEERFKHDPFVGPMPQGQPHPSPWKPESKTVKHYR